MARCPNGTRRNKATGNCEPTHGKTVKSRSPSPSPKPKYTYNEFCKICSELYGVSFTYFYRHGGEMRHLYYVYNKNNAKFVFPKDLKKIMIGSPAERFHTREPYTGLAKKNKTGITANVALKDMTRSELYNSGNI